MSLKRPLLLTAALISAASTVHSQSANPPAVGSVQPASLFGDALPASEPRAPASSAFLTIHRDASQPASVALPARSGPVQPWLFNLAKPAAAGPDDTSEAGPGEVDLSALRYFASQNDLVRVAAEIRLLRAKNPGWEPPEDLFSQVASGEAEKPLWELFAKHDIDGLKAAMDELRHSKPDWQPSSDLVNKMALAEARDDLVHASDAQQWGAVLDIAASHKMLMTCSDVDALWRTAEALVRTGDEARATEAYRYILTSCRNREQRLATVQKASVLLQAPDDVEGLLRLGQRLANGRNEFEPVRLDLMRAKIGTAAAGKTDTLPSQAEVDAITAHARTTGDRADAQLLGWYAYSRKQFVDAEAWFRSALKTGPDPKAAEGLVLTLRDAGKTSEAQTLAEQYAPLDPLNRKLMVELMSAALNDPKQSPLSPEQLTKLATAIDTEKSADAAQAYGWYLYKVENLAGAETWFSKSANWSANESAAVGLVVAAKRLGHLRDYSAAVTKYKATYPKVAELEAAMQPKQRVAVRVVEQRSRRVRVAEHRRGTGVANLGERSWDQSADSIVKTYQVGSYDQTLAMLEQRKLRKGSEPGGLTIVRGWALYNKGDWEGAKQVFAEADKKGLLVRRRREPGLSNSAIRCRGSDNAGGAAGPCVRRQQTGLAAGCMPQAPRNVVGTREMSRNGRPGQSRASTHQPAPAARSNRQHKTEVSLVLERIGSDIARLMVGA